MFLLDEGQALSEVVYHIIGSIPIGVTLWSMCIFATLSGASTRFLILRRLMYYGLQYRPLLPNSLDGISSCSFDLTGESKRSKNKNYRKQQGKGMTRWSDI